MAREKKTHFMVAMKVLFKSEIIKGRVEKQIGHEIEIQSRLRYVSLVSLVISFGIPLNQLKSIPIYIMIIELLFDCLSGIRTFYVCTHISMTSEESIWHWSSHPKVNSIVIYNMHRMDDSRKTVPLVIRIKSPMLFITAI